MKFLLDENSEGFDKELMKMGHQIEYAKKLREKNKKFRNDINLIFYAKDNEMIIITKDYDLGQACKDNDYPCIWITDDKIFEKIILSKLNRRCPEYVDNNERANLLQVIKTRIKFIIADTEILLNNNGQLPIVAALYIHAVEEYGKYCYVADLPSSKGIVEIKMGSKFLSHGYKINLALKQLPKECAMLHEGGYGSNYGGNYDTDTPTDWPTRLTIFNTDVKNGRALHLPEVDHDNLKKAIEKFKSVLQKLN